jgi:hypothetical protein
MLHLFSVFFVSGYEVLTVVTIRNVSGLGHRVVWYTVLNVLEEQSVSVFAGSQKMEAVRTDRNVGTHQPDYTAP